MDQTTRLNICRFNRLCKLMNLTSNGFEKDSDNENNLFHIRSSFFQILLPIILLFGIFISIAIALMAQRIVVEMFKKRRRNTRVNHGRGSLASPSGVPISSGLRREINSISSNFNSLPTYAQVMENLKKNEDFPPSYFEVTKDNHHFTTTAKSNTSNQQFRAVNLRSQQTESTTVLSAELNLERLPQTSLNKSFVKHSYSCGESPTSSLKPILTHDEDEPVSIIIHDIDELVNSISVSTSLTHQSNEINDETLITRCEDFANGVDGIQTIDMTNQFHISRADTSASLVSTPL